MLATRLMPQTGTLRRNETVSDGRGGWERKPLVVVAAGVRCKYDPSARAEEVVGDQQRASLNARLFVPAGTPVQRGDVFDLDDGRRLFIDAVERPGGRRLDGAGDLLRCLVEEIQKGSTVPGEAPEPEPDPEPVP